MKKKSKIILKSIMTFVLTIAMVLGVSMPPVYASGDTDENFTVKFKYEGKTYVDENVSSSDNFELSDILSELEITGTVTEASVSEDQGMTVTTSMLTMSKPFGSGWLEVTVNGNKYHIVIETLPNNISVVLYGTLFFDKNGGSGEMVLTDPLDGTRKNAVYVKEYSNYQLPECGYTAPDGYEFSKWEINGNQYSAGETYVFGQTTTAKAIWKLRDGAHSISATYETSEGEVIISPTKAVQGETVTVSVQPVAGKAVESITYSYGTTSNQELILKSGETNVYEFTMPENDVTVSVTFKDVSKTPISYVDANGTPKSCDEYSFVSSNDTTWSGWVVASTEMTIDGRVNVNGTANLILTDGKTLTVTNGIQVSEGSTLNIYSQSQNTGALIAGNSQNTYNAGIGGNKSSNNAGTITINGGKITAIGGYDSAGIGGASLAKAGTITIQGKADVTATSGKGAAGIGTAPGGIGGSVTITGNAKVNAIGTEYSSGGGAGIGGGRNGYCDSIIISGGTVTATSSYGSAAIGTSKSGKGGTISITGGNITATGIKGSSVGIGGQCNSVTIGGTAVVTATGNTNNAGIGGFEGDSADVLVNIEGGTVKAYSSGNSGAAAIGSGNKAKGKTTINISGGTIEAYGNAVYGVGIGGGNTGSSTEVVNVNITGGDVTATGRTGIGTGNASEADQTITISGGIVKASGDTYNSNNGAAIGQGNNSKSHTVINIIGGKVSADGSGNGIGAGANTNKTPTIKLRWTGTEDEFTAISYVGNVTLEKSFKNKSKVSEIFAAGELTDNSVIANKTLIPADTDKFAVIIDDISYGGITPDPRTQTAGQTVTLTIQPVNGSTMDAGTLSVTYTDGNGTHTVSTTQDSTDSNKYTFTMPSADVTVTAKFTSAWQNLQKQINANNMNIILTGDVVACDGESALQVPEGKTAVIDLNGHKIDRNLSYGIKAGYVMEVRGTLTIKDSSSGQNGKITGGNHKGSSPSTHGGGIMVEASGILTLESGSITGNTSEHFGGGVCLKSFAKFYMEGGSITGNTAMNGAGIAARDNSTLSISGGTISGNTASYNGSGNGGGVYYDVDAQFIMTGGEIKNNTAARDSGGIHYASRGAFKLGGSATVTDNTAGGKAYNVRIPDGKTLTIESALTGTIGITTVTAPTETVPIVFTNGLSDKGNQYNFTSDNLLYMVNVNSSGEAELNLSDHDHDFTYSVDGATIKATCIADGCPLPDKSATLTIKAPTGLTYDGTAKAATLTGGIPGVTTPSIVYKQGDTDLASAPINAGRYTASITVGGKTASISYTIEPKSITIPKATSGLKWTGDEQTGVADASGYKVTDGKATAVGNYTATVALKDKTNTKWSDNSTVDQSIEWSIGKADGPAAPTGLTATAPTTDGGSDGKISGVNSTMEYSDNSGFTSKTDCAGTEITGLSAGTYYVRVKETETHEVGGYATVKVPAYVALTYEVTYKVVNGTWSDDSTTNKTEIVQSGSKPASVPTGMKAGSGYMGGAWDKDPAEATITGATTFTYTFTAIPTYTVTYKVVGGTWSDDSTTNKTEIVQSGSKPASVPTGMKAGSGYMGGAWDKDPAEATITGATTFTYTFTAKQAAIVKKAPTAKTLTYTGSAQELVAAGEATGGTMYYAATTENTAPADNLYTTSIPTATNAGTYYVWYKVVGDDNLNNSEAEKVTVTISQLSIKNATVSLDKTDLVYTGSEQSVQVSSVKIGETVLKANSDYEVSGTTGTNKGDYTVTVTGKGNYKDVVTSKWNIAMATPVIDVLPSASAITYGQSLADSTLTEGTAKLGENVVEGTFSWKNDATKPVVSDSEKTEYVVVFTPNDADNLNTVECKVKVTVNKAIAGVAKAPTANTLIYNGKAQVLVKTGEATDGIMNYAIGKDDKTAPAEGWNTSIPTATGAGTYYVWYKVVGNENYTDYNADTPIRVVIAKSDTIPKNLPDKMSVSQSVDKIEQGILDAFVGWKWAEGEIGKEIPEGGSVSANAIYGGSDKDNYNITEATVEVSRANHDHTGGKATCHEQAVCEICGQPYGGLDATNHSGETEIRDGKAVSCTQDGYTGDTYCLGCDTMIQKGTLIPAEGHVPAEAVKENEVTATCTTAGSYIEVVKCSVCGEEISRNTVTVPATGHDWGDWKVVKPATETEEGVEERVCKKDSSHKETRSISKLEPKPATETQDNPPAGNDTTPAAKGVTLEDAGTKALYTVISDTGEEPAVEYKASESITDKKVIIPDSVTINGVTYKITKIADNAFAKNKKIEKVVLSSNIKSIGNGAFLGCTRLKSVTIPANVIEISDKAFKGCTSLTGIKIGNGVTKVGASAFEGCKKLKTIIVKTTKLESKTVAKNAFKGVGKKVTIKVPKKMKKAYTKLFRKKGLSKKVKIK